MNRQGSILISALMVIGFSLLVGAPLMQAANLEYQAAINIQVSTQAFYLAEAGVVHAISAARAKLELLQGQQLSAWLSGQFVVGSDSVRLLPGPVTREGYGHGNYSATVWLERSRTALDEDYQYLVRIVSTGTAGGSRSISRKVEVRVPIALDGMDGGSGDDIFGIPLWDPAS